MRAVVLPDSSACLTSGHVIISNSTGASFDALAFAVLAGAVSGFAAGGYASAVVTTPANTVIDPSRRCMVNLLFATRPYASRKSRGRAARRFRPHVASLYCDRFLLVTCNSSCTARLRRHHRAPLR